MSGGGHNTVSSARSAKGRLLLLIQPAIREPLQSNLPPSVERLRGKNPPLGLMYLAAAAAPVDGWRVEILDGESLHLTDAALARRVTEARPDLVGVSSTTFTYKDALRTARVARQAHPNAPVVMGGVHPFIFPDETLAQPEVDAIFYGEVEEVFPRWLEQVGDELPASGCVPGYRRKGDDAPGGPAPTVKKLDRIPPPAWDMTPIPMYRSLATRHAPVSILLSSRGCPFHCRYCALSPTGKNWRAHSAERVVDEMRTCRSLGIRYAMFYDEIFTISKDRVMAICEQLSRAEIGLPWLARATTDTVDDNVLRAMKEAGCDTVTFGVEAGDDGVLEALGRRIRTQRTLEAFASARRLGLSTIAYFMIGNPGETDEHVSASLRVAARLRPSMVHASNFMLYPATDLYDEAVREGRVPDFWRTFAAEPHRPESPIPAGPGGDDPHARKLLRRFYLRFFLRPGFIRDRLADFLRGRAPWSVGDLARLTRGWLRVVWSHAE